MMLQRYNVCIFITDSSIQACINKTSKIKEKYKYLTKYETKNKELNGML